MFYEHLFSITKKKKKKANSVAFTKAIKTNRYQGNLQGHGQERC